jgi:hypothetical protein
MPYSVECGCGLWIGKEAVEVYSKISYQHLPKGILRIITMKFNQGRGSMPG